MLEGRKLLIVIKQEKVIAPHRKIAESPMYCDICNPSFFFEFEMKQYLNTNHK